MSRRELEYASSVVVIGLPAGVAGIAITLLWHTVEHLTYHYSSGALRDGVGSSSPLRRALGPMVGGAVAGLGWWLLVGAGAVNAAQGHRSAPPTSLRAPVWAALFV
ncbi:hypothetical protein [Mycobacterium sp. PS03_16]|uniref:hypothetical protein n=1 Tax=Mycobacterium sp. PS03-16 TaxID=2559611 RepID=UPI001ADD6B9F